MYYLFHMLEKFLKCSKVFVKVTRLGLTLKLNILRQVTEKNKTLLGHINKIKMCLRIPAGMYKS